MRKLVIFGTGDVAQIAHDYFERDTDYNVVAFCVDDEFRGAEKFMEKPLIGFENVVEEFSPDLYEMFIGLSYTDMNKLREKKFHEAIDKGYELASYVSPRCSYLTKNNCGRNCFVFEDNTIQPYVEIGDNVILWSGNHIGHHSKIESHNFISSHVVVSGHCHISSNCFLGVNSTLGHQVKIAPENLIGAGAIITKDTEYQGVYVAPRTTKLEKPSSAFQL